MGPSNWTWRVAHKIAALFPVDSLAPQENTTSILPRGATGPRWGGLRNPVRRFSKGCAVSGSEQRAAAPVPDRPVKTEWESRAGKSRTLSEDGKRAAPQTGSRPEVLATRSGYDISRRSKTLSAIPDRLRMCAAMTTFALMSAVRL